MCNDLVLREKAGLRTYVFVTGPSPFDLGAGVAGGDEKDLPMGNIRDSLRSFTTEGWGRTAGAADSTGSDLAGDEAVGAARSGVRWR